MGRIFVVVSPTFTNRKSGCFFEDYFIKIIGLESRNNSVRYYDLFYCGFGWANPPLRALHIHPLYLAPTPFCVHEVIVNQTINSRAMRADMILNNPARPKFYKKHPSPLPHNITYRANRSRGIW